jgi:hypothetical protein
MKISINLIKNKIVINKMKIKGNFVEKKRD